MSDVKLVETEKGLTLCGDGMEVRGDFSKMLPRIQSGKVQGEMLVKAAKIKNATGLLTAVDATAGLGEDSILLAAAGFRVYMCEKDETIALLLEDALKRAKKDPKLSAIVGRMILIKGDSKEFLLNMEEKPDVVYLDPMFPERQKSALVKKKFQLLHNLEAPCTDGDELLNAAIASGPRKIVIKRPLKGEPLAGIKPDYTYEGKAIRYDCLTFARTESEK